MKKFISFIAALLFALPAFAQVGPGPGPTPDPWIVNGAQIYYSQGCVTVSATAPGACNGTGSVNTDSLWIKSGGAIHGTAVLPLTGLATQATNTIVANVTSGSASPTAYAMSSCAPPSALEYTTNTGIVCTSLASGVVTTLSFGTTGLTPSSATSGAVTVAGTLGVANGGTGVATLTGIPKASGTSAFVAATSGTDYCAPGTTCTFTAQQILSGTSSNLSTSLVNAKEPAIVSATAATGTINYDACTQSILYYTTNASANWTENFRCSSGTTLASVLNTGDVLTLVHMVAQGSTAYYNSAYHIDGTATGVTVIWQGGTAPSAGNASGTDVYTYSIIKTAATPTYTVLASQVQYK